MALLISPMIVPIVIVALLAGYLFVPTSRDPSHGKLDPLGAALSMVGLGALLYAIIQAPVNGWGSASTIAAFVLSALAITAFILWELNTATPMLPMEFFKNRRFSIGSATITLTFFTMFGLFFILTLYLQFVLGYSPVIAGVSTFPLGVIGALIFMRMVDKPARWAWFVIGTIVNIAASQHQNPGPKLDSACSSDLCSAAKG